MFKNSSAVRSFFGSFQFSLLSEKETETPLSFAFRLHYAVQPFKNRKGTDTLIVDTGGLAFVLGFVQFEHNSINLWNEDKTSVHNIGSEFNKSLAEAVSLQNDLQVALVRLLERQRKQKGATAYGPVQERRSSQAFSRQDTCTKVLTHPLGNDLKRIRGIDAHKEKKLKQYSFGTYTEIASWEMFDIDRVNGLLKLPFGTIEFEDWIGQAEILSKGGSTEFSIRYDQGVQVRA